MRFNIVTPVLNGEKFINETILSVVSQTGPFSIRYHVQDGVSTDSTIKLLTAWQNRLANDFPINCAGIEFSFSSEPDRGLYDAVNRGFTACGDSDLMAWINADDRYEPGAFVTVAEIFDGAAHRDQRNRRNAAYFANRSIPTNSHSRWYFRGPFRAAFHSAGRYVLATQIVGKDRWSQCKFPACRRL